MALSHYLLQSVVCTALFYGYGMGLYNQIGMAWGLVMTLAIFASQLSLSAFWLARFRFGPLEWLWRSLTYGSFQSTRKM
jgi:uncharacterized protein